ncbi:IS3 family transposase [Hymenobacter sp. BT186]|uniref:IS3 family transposase n=1 Tax=Hymenobacter telluris TaxID=2816474 RepID=A0A939F064_9BACT|nr:IS3 family transposase [Hymenobacter telluris]MBO0360720.1 IS3 family transposase [Hymenobacter telluris]MBW3376747.1 IS3 family transposase [Hymenobacter norwichensis]
MNAEGHAIGRYALRIWLYRHATGPWAPTRNARAQPWPKTGCSASRPPPPNQIWVGDITYLPLLGGRWCYPVMWRGACSRRVVGWHLATQMPTELVLLALEQALTLRQPAPGLIVHADHGSQHTSAACHARIEAAGAVSSFSRPGNPYDNTQAEAGWSTLKTELLSSGIVFASLEEARLKVTHYLDTYFNLGRRHSALNYRSPLQFEYALKLNLPNLTVRFH